MDHMPNLIHHSFTSFNKQLTWLLWALVNPSLSFTFKHSAGQISMITIFLTLNRMVVMQETLKKKTLKFHCRTSSWEELMFQRAGSAAALHYFSNNQQKHEEKLLSIKPMCCCYVAVCLWGPRVSRSFNSNITTLINTLASYTLFCNDAPSDTTSNLRT